ncbi:hypothetical protein Nepgr_007114 [Nepenthes gracilis]|uniref:Transcription repressor n=1 Tax=Nepenthes gracilis TaxID=150966 RepID=A0AAD3S6L2_NEPGR|nr:hypothetical protein Nepgr_007114 [Nepenthes gracilis]
MKDYSTLCCGCRLSVSSAEEAESLSSSSNRYPPISSLAHYMVQERLDQMIRQGKCGEVRNENMRRKRGRTRTRFVLMVAMEKSSFDPRDDFRQSVLEMIIANQIEKARDLRYLLKCYIQMNSEDYTGIILEVFHEVCTKLFL